MLRDRLVCGLRDKKLQQTLLARRDLTLDLTLDMVVATQTATKDATEMVTSEGKLLKMRVKGSRSAQHCIPNTKQGNAWKPCYRCGRTSHRVSDSGFRKKACFHRGKMGHVAQRCPSRKTTLDAEANVFLGPTLVTTTVLSLFQQPCRESSLNLIAPVKLLFTWCGGDLLAELDTSSPVCVIPKRTYEENMASWPWLPDITLSISCHLG